MTGELTEAIFQETLLYERLQFEGENDKAAHHYRVRAWLRELQALRTTPEEREEKLAAIRAALEDKRILQFEQVTNVCHKCFPDGHMPDGEHVMGPGGIIHRADGKCEAYTKDREIFLGIDYGNGPDQSCCMVFHKEDGKIVVDDIMREPSSDQMFDKVIDWVSRYADPIKKDDLLLELRMRKLDLDPASEYDTKFFHSRFVEDGDECPFCECGTVAINENVATCRGECGGSWWVEKP